MLKAHRKSTVQMDSDSTGPLARGICWKPAAASDFGDILGFDKWSALGKTYLACTLNKIVQGSGEYSFFTGSLVFKLIFKFILVCGFLPPRK